MGDHTLIEKFSDQRVLCCSLIHSRLTSLYNQPVMRTSEFPEIVTKRVNVEQVDPIEKSPYRKRAYCLYYSTTHPYPKNRKRIGNIIKLN